MMMMTPPDLIGLERQTHTEAVSFDERFRNGRRGKLKRERKKIESSVGGGSEEMKNCSALQ